ncbi:hypothetical protein, partial [Streptomyces mirabilis]
STLRPIPWSASDTGVGNSEHLALIRRWLAGEIVNNTVGIAIVAGPFNGQTEVVNSTRQGCRPKASAAAPAGYRGPGTHRQTHLPGSPGLDTSAGWTYEYVGVGTSTED